MESLEMIINGNNGDNVLLGTNDDDILNGKGGNDRLIGNKGDDKNNGDAGHDTIVWNNGDGSDTNNGGAGNDTQEVNGSNTQGDEFVVKAGGNDFLFDRVNLGKFTLNDQNIEKLEVNGGGGDDKLTVGNLAGSDLNKIIFKGGDGNDWLDASKTDVAIEAWGGKGNDKLYGGSAKDVLNGDAGNDLLVGNKGDDKNNGGAGNDTIVWNNGDGSDTNNGGSGNDTQVVNGSKAQGDEFVVKAGGNDFLFDRVNLGKFTLNDQNIEKLEVNGGGGDDKLTVGNLAGSDLNKIIFKGGDGNDWLDATKTHVKIEAYGGKGDDKLWGGSGDDILKGDQGDDILSGGKGDDKLYGGAGHDTLTGGAGHDTFYVDHSDTITDTIKDFQAGIDSIVFV